jgi:MFS family permease
VTGPGKLLPYCLVAGSMSLGYGSIYTLLADLRDRYGFSEAQLGVIVAAGFLAGFVTQLALARLADRGYAPLLVRGGIVLAMGAMIGSAVATQFWAFLLARLLLGLGSGAVGPAIRRIVITREPDAVGANLGRLAAFDVAGFMLGPLVAAVVAEALGIRAPFVFLAAVFVGVFLLSSRLDLTAGVSGIRSRHPLRVLLVRPAIQATLAACVAFYVTVGMFEAIWAVLLRDHGAETWLIGLTLSLFTLPMIFLAPIGGRRRRRAVRCGSCRSASRSRRSAPSPTECCPASGCCWRCRWCTRSRIRSPCPATRWRPRSAARRSTSRPRRDCSVPPAWPRRASPAWSPGSCTRRRAGSQCAPAPPS